MLDYLKLLRPIQWIKNLLIFVPIIFAKELFIEHKLATTSFAFFTFCLIASSMYVVNDIFDRKIDVLHPQKQFRPIASGKVSLKAALLLAFILLFGSSLMVYFYIPHIWRLFVIYFVLNLAYSLYLKHVVIFDILVIAGFYLLRILVGGFSAGIYISRWLVLCTIFSALLVIIGKRRSELSHSNQRKVLKFYTPELLDSFLVISAALTLVSYGVYSVLGVKSELMVYSILFVLLGVFRYIYLIHTSAQAEYPEKIFVSDKTVLASLIGWGVFIGYVFYGLS
jgi:4-hydroxybenzoate polyprenyltransferase